MTDLATMTPPAIDAILNDLGYQRAKLVARVEGLRRAARQARTGRYPDTAHAAKLEAQAAQYEPQITAITDQMQPYNNEFDRRGGWTRAFLVQSNNGHVHKSMSCSTCYPSTRYAWLTDYSGKDEEQIVYAAGELGCTVCYPSAPSDILTRVGEIRRPTDLEREQRAAEKATRNAKRAAAAIIDPNTGATLYKTGRAAMNAIAIALDNLRWYGDDHPSADEWHRTVDTAVTALAAKQGIDKDAAMTEFQQRADKKFATTARKRLREHHQREGSIVVEDLVPGLQAWVREHGIPA